MATGTKLSGLQTLVRLLADYMNLPKRVALYAQDWKFPDGKDIWIILKIERVEPLEKKSIPFEEGSKEIFVRRSFISADMIGRPHDIAKDPRGRYFEMGLAPISQIGQEYQQRNCVSIQTSGEAVDLSDSEGAGVLCKFRQMFVICDRAEKKSDGGYFGKVGETKIEVQQ